MDTHLLAFAGVVTLLAISPGPDLALVTNVALTDRRRTAFATSLGIGAGLFVHATASAVGIAGLLLASPALFKGLKVAAATYLIYLGLRAAWAARTHLRAGAPGGVTAAPPLPRGWRPAMLRGFVVNVLNPNVSLFYLAMLPQFVAGAELVLPRAWLLASIHFVIGRLWHAACIVFVSRLVHATRRARPALELLSAVALVAFALVMLVKR